MFLRIFISLWFLLNYCHCRSPELEQLVPFKTVQKDDSIVLTCSVSKGSKPITFEWFHNLDKLFPSNDLTIDVKSSASILTFDRFRIDNVGNYSCVASNLEGTDKSFTFLQI